MKSPPSHFVRRYVKDSKVDQVMSTDDLEPAWLLAISWTSNTFKSRSKNKWSWMIWPGLWDDCPLETSWKTQLVSTCARLPSSYEKTHKNDGLSERMESVRDKVNEVEGIIRPSQSGRAMFSGCSPWLGIKGSQSFSYLMSPPVATGDGNWGHKFI